MRKCDKSELAVLQQLKNKNKVNKTCLHAVLFHLIIFINQESFLGLVGDDLIAKGTLFGNLQQAFGNKKIDFYCKNRTFPQKNHLFRCQFRSSDDGAARTQEHNLLSN
jgi:hypothetical protein